ncbi:peptidoglycan L-alanyl-D-glutamate endopeptidase CwlK [Clostridium acetobutylicum]|uniref:Cell wall biogenesis enzyme (N-terminal domain related to N-Acetylmuramoyl-L-alanine amidase and C-terminal domain related to L-alanoyl-D-glutamate peptidase) peptodoglycan-binding domain n=1 Tax=Clostridium acetobutylicum (strain ATCC 824 / DSM 792 / JCM 1419 / IAM 19013 / LMG 5710 / NBRC 13948 / NRRL B-527 / VKM B-1787 / 2291 / W) TaxID=272562 RepID=Q97KB0_CLOAB|nr:MULTISPECIES: peptidoglycan-binding protein [Clostridium]AAK78985.1 Cell wall biogenesis enzyme (N-terminal domain related to N-Acetylmuramoyl-L-alanine amidase and C-terminal domain related to L-alanoyl-D-glutamate peptidase); peptodoglycan-binding domain [Clostridium acetobutylicum ATCC 824]ADZ20060.1 Cell wall biogenesis enzyme [Clostridium acetobutylicum EA 2018]AEI34284.1 cell wall biogenesis enzymedomain-containing, L-alanoyl-D-glutamate peptidase [Clostridium acetobutylicum DSM 1731]A
MPTFPTLRLYYEGPSVRILQMNLYGLNYRYNGLKVTGVFDSLTYEVVRDFQVEHKLVPDGIVGPITWSVLLSQVTSIQNKLNSVYFTVGTPNGIFGPVTIDAVTRFQSVNGLVKNGVVDPRTRQQLFNPNPVINYSNRPSSISLSSLNPYVALLAQRFLNLCTANGLNVRVIQAFRSWYEQDQLYTQGRTMPGNIVTDAQGGDSYHNWGLAFDCAPVENGQVSWNDITSFNEMGRLGQQVGLEWGGNWTSYAITLVDAPHFQYTFGLSTEQLLNGARPV